MDFSIPGLPPPHHLPEFAQVHVHCIGDTVQPSHPLIPSSSAFYLSQHQKLFQWVLYLHQMTKILELQLQHQPSHWIFRLISLKIDWFDLLAVQRAFRSLLQHCSLKALNLWHSAFFMVQLSQPYMTTGKTIALTIWTFVSRVMSLLFNTLTRFVITFLPRSNHLLISWLQSWSTGILESKKRKSVTTSTFSPFICQAVMGLDAMILVFLIFSLKLTLSLSFTLIKRLFSSWVALATKLPLQQKMQLVKSLILHCHSLMTHLPSSLAK